MFSPTFVQVEMDLSRSATLLRFARIRFFSKIVVSLQVLKGAVFFISVLFKV